MIPSKTLFVIIALAWAYGLALLAMKGINYVARAAQILNWVPLLMILIVLWANKSGIANYHPAENKPFEGFLMVLSIVIGFFATAGAAGADFGINNRNRSDIFWGGLTGIALAIVVAGSIPILSVAGHIGQSSPTGSAAQPGAYTYAAAVSSASVGQIASAP